MRRWRARRARHAAKNRRPLHHRGGDSPDHTTTPAATVLRPRRVQPGTPPLLPCLATAHTPSRAYAPPRMPRHHTHTPIEDGGAVPPRRRDPARAMNMQTPRHPTSAATGRARRATRAPPPAAVPHSIRGPLDGMATAGTGKKLRLPDGPGRAADRGHLVSRLAATDPRPRALVALPLQHEMTLWPAHRGWALAIAIGLART